MTCVHKISSKTTTTTTTIYLPNLITPRFLHFTSHVFISSPASSYWIHRLLLHVQNTSISMPLYAVDTIREVALICHSCTYDNTLRGSPLMQRGAVTGRNTFAFTAAFALGYRKVFRKLSTFAETHHTERSTE